MYLCLMKLMVFLNYFLETVNFEKNQQAAKLCDALCGPFSMLRCCCRATIQSIAIIS